MSVRGFNTGSGIEQYDYDYLDNKPDAPTKESIGLGNVDNTSDMDKPVSTLQAQALSNKVDKVPGMGLSREDYTSEDRAKLEALPTNEELEADLAGKASAETVAILESAVNDPDNGLETKASAIINTASGTIASFSDGADGMPVKKLVVAVEPQQDLHGYGNPWPGGGGKNLNPGAKYDANIFTAQADGTLLVNGEATETRNYYFINSAVNKANALHLPAGTYTASYTVLSGTLSAASGGFGFFYWEGDSETRQAAQASITASQASHTFTDDAYIFPVLYVTTGTTANNAVIGFQIESGSTKTAYAPYSNICPISGWTGAEVTRTGKNLFPDILSMLEQGSIEGSNGINTSATNRVRTANMVPFPFDDIVEAGYTITKPDGYDFAVRYYDKDGNYIFISSSYTGFVNSLSMTAFMGIGVAYAKFVIRKSDNSNITPNDIANIGLQIELGSTATAYEPFQSKEISVTFPSSAGTVYGATITINPDRTGTLVVEDAAVDLGTLEWTLDSVRFKTTELVSIIKKTTSNSEILAGLICEMYKTGSNNQTGISSGVDNIIAVATTGNLFVKATSYATVADFVSAVTGVKVVYPLATPITYTLTAEEVSGILTTLYGTNNIWTDCGNSTVEYTADTKLFIEQLTQPTEDDMTADHAISAGTFFQLGNTLYLATSQIAAGATITLGTNATQLSLADALNTLNS